MKTNIKLFFLFVALIALDQFAKNIFPTFFCNKNIAWNVPVSAGIFYLIWIVIIAALIYIFLRTKSFNQRIFLVLIFSGAASNFFDRIRFGCVVDYIDLKIFPVLNLADIYITVGIIFLLFVIAIPPWQEKQSRIS